MGDPTIPTKDDIDEAIALAKEHLEAVNNDEESWLDRILHPDIGVDDDSAQKRYAIYVMMNELVRSRPIVLAARAEARTNGDCSPSLKAAVDGYESDEVSPFGETDP